MTMHHFTVRIYWEDTDAGGVVYYANYLKFAERARTEMLREYGIHQQQLRHESGLMFVVRRCEIDYHRSAMLDDTLTIRSRITHFGKASLTMAQEIWRGEEKLTSLTVSLACINETGRPAKIPAHWRELLPSTYSEYE